MRAGEVVADRFEVVRLAGSGGMGAVWRARDRSGGGPVALKTLHDPNPAHAERFLREARVLAELHHPGVVRYLAHGRTDEGLLYLAMEWLDGEDLAQRLRGEGVSASEAVRLARRVAETLAAAHEKGIVHRDLKPSNLFLVSGQVEQVKLLDFGIARLTEAAGASTRTGVMLGTPGYMAPEQARGERTVDGRSDLFSLGCVLFECLTGLPPFHAEHPMAVLAKILLDEAPRLSEHRTDLAGAPEALVARLLSKDPAARPASAQALLAELQALGDLSNARPPPAPSRVPKALTTGERRLCSVVLAGRPEALRQFTDEATLMSGASSGDDRTHTSVEVPRAGELVAALGPVVERLGGRVENLAQGALVITLTGGGVATDQAARAARAALAVRARAPELPVAVSTGRGVVTGRWPLGEVIDRAAALLAGYPASPPAGAVRLDPLTAGLLGAGFTTAQDGRTHWLTGERGGGEGGVRLLLGKPTPCVGRERELSRLQGVVAEAVEEPAARAVLVVAPPGLGKSRLRDELLARLRGPFPELAIWQARADAARAGSPFGLLGQLLLRALELGEDAPPAARQARLRERTARLGPEAERVAAFLCELVGAPLEEGAHAPLTAARADAQLMADQLRRAWEDFVAAEVAQRPVLLVLDDLHWGDWPTVRLVDAALRRLADAPLCVLALARPEVREHFPSLWAERGLEELRLRELPRKAAEALVRAVLGEGVSPERVAALAAQADGNAFHLEELIRAQAQGGEGAVPETVLAMVEARLEALEPLARRILRAGSIFGRRFFRGGLRALLGDPPGAELDDGLSRLLELELIEREPGGPFAGEATFTFRHALVQEAASAMLTEADAALGHRLAAAWLEAAGERDALALADHYRRGGEPERAVGHYARAAEEALRANDLAGAVERARRGEECGARGEALGQLLLARAEAHQWRGEFGEAESCASQSLELLEPDSETWFRAAAVAGSVLTKLGDPSKQGVLVLLGEALAGPVRAELRPGAFATAAVRSAWSLFITGAADLGTRLLDRVEAVAGPAAEGDPRAAAALAVSGATRTMLSGDTVAWIDFERATAEAYQRMGDLRRATEARVHAGYALGVLGAFAEAEAALRAALADADRQALPTMRGNAQQNLGWVLALAGRLPEAEAALNEALAFYAQAGDHRMEGGTLIYLSRALVAHARAEEAEQLLARALPLLQATPPLLAVALATRAQALLLLGRPSEARAEARASMKVVAEQREVEEGEEFIRLADIETALAVGEQAHARAALAEARARLEAKVALIRDPARREGFLRIAEHARLLSLDIP